MSLLHGWSVLEGMCLRPAGLSSGACGRQACPLEPLQCCIKGLAASLSILAVLYCGAAVRGLFGLKGYFGWESRQ
jgi:hypothetical protein